MPSRQERINPPYDFLNPLGRFKEIPVSESPSCVILGRFKHKDVIDETIRLFEANGIKVNAPRVGNVVTEDDGGYKLLDSDQGKEPWDIAKNFFNAIPESDFVYIVNPENLVGMEVAMEIGWTRGGKVPIYATEQVEYVDQERKGFQPISVVSPMGMVKMVKEGVIWVDMEQQGWAVSREQRPGNTPQGEDTSDRLLWEFTRRNFGKKD